MKRLRCPHCGYFRLIMNEDEFLECQECGWYEDPDREDEEDGDDDNGEEELCGGT